MRFSPLLRLFVEAFDVRLELVPIDSPDATAADLDGGQFSRANQCVHLRNAHAEIRGHILEGQESRLDLRTRLFGRGLTWHQPRIPADGDGYMDLAMFAAV